MATTKKTSTASKTISTKTATGKASTQTATVAKKIAKKPAVTKPVSSEDLAATSLKEQEIPSSGFSEINAQSPNSTSEKSRIIKKYPNRRLYDTLHSTYVTLFDIKGLVMSNIPFHVVDAKSGDDITRSILMQIILEEEAGGQPIFSKQSLLKMIRFYGNSLQGMMAPFLEQNLNQFLELQNQYVAHCQKIGGLVSPETWGSFVNKQNSVDFSQPMNYLFETGSKILEQLQSQSINAFPFKKSN